VRYLLDEQLDQVVAASMAPIASKSDDEFLHILAVARPGTPDDEIPRLCRERDVDCLVTANVRDFDARKFYYQALLAEDLHVVTAARVTPHIWGLKSDI
jgi:hypothetical protein